LNEKVAPSRPFKVGFQFGLGIFKSQMFKMTNLEKQNNIE
jgi:hypothetical protein